MEGRGTIAAFFWLGIGTLFPWNAFITESDYFLRRFAGSPFENTFESAFGLGYNGANLVSLVLLLFVKQFFSDRHLIVIPLLTTGMVFALTAWISLIQVHSSLLFFAMTITGVCLAGVMSAPIVSAVCALAAQRSKSASSAIFIGQAFAGVVTSIVSLITVKSSPMQSNFCNNSSTWFVNTTHNSNLLADYEIDWGAFVYFAVAFLVSISCILVYVFLPGKTPITEGLGDEYSIMEEHPSLFAHPSSRSSTIIAGDYEPLLEVPDIVNSLNATRESDLGAEEYNGRHFNRLPPQESWDISTVYQVWRITYYPVTAALTVYLVTLSIFPSMTAFTESTHRCEPGSGRFVNDLFVPFLFLLFNSSDLIGRVCQGVYQPFRCKSLLRLALLRCIFIPLFWFCQVKDSQLNVLFDHDAFPIMFTALCGFTNGFIGSGAMVLAARLVPSAHRDLASTLSVLALTLGLTLGCIASYGSVYIVVGS